MIRVLNNCKKLYKLNNFSYSRYVTTVTTIQRVFSTTRLQKAKIFVDTENAYCYGIITSPFNANTNKSLPLQLSSPEHLTREAFEETLNQNFRSSSAMEIVATFIKVLPFCIEQQISITDPLFNALVDGLMDHAEQLTDDQLLNMLDVLRDLPPVPSIKDHNFHDVWSCLDDMCCWRISRWRHDMLLRVAEKWYLLNLGKVCDFLFEALEKMKKKPSRDLSKDQLVRVFFLLNVSRRNSVDFEYEHALYEKVEAMNVDELAIVALGYFKSQTKVKIPAILSEMLRKAKDAEDIHEMSLCAILKIVRYTSHPTLADQMVDFLEYLTPKLPEYSTLCVLHAALLGTTLQILHKPSLRIAAQRIASNISNLEQVRLKDIERLLLALTMLDFDPQTTPCIFKVAMEELHAERRHLEIVRHQKCLGAALSFLSIKNMYSVDLMNKVLDPQFVNEVYGKSAKMFPRELLVLNMNACIEVPEYSGPKLDRVKQIKIAKWLTAFTPTRDSKKRLTLLDKLILDVNDTIAEIVGGTERMFIEHLLPQYLRADVVICRDKTTQRFVKPKGFDNYEFGELMWAPKEEDKDYYVIVTLGWNSTIRGTSDPVGLAHMKMRHLQKIGYIPLSVIWNEFLHLPHGEKRKYIANKIEHAK